MWLLPATTLLAQVPMYTGVDLPVSFVPTAINASGQMAGYGTASGGSVHAMVYSNGNLIDLGVLPGGDHSEARAINASGQVVGNSTKSGGLTHAFLYSGGVMIDLGTLPGGATSYATAINDAGQITGWSDVLQPGTSFPRPEHAFRYSGGVMADLGNISTTGQFVNFSHGEAINATGQVVGWSVTDNFDTHAFAHSGGAMVDLGTLGGSESRARGINDAGVVVGWSYTSGDTARHAFRHAGSMIDLGTLPGNNNSLAVAINGIGQAIGNSTFSGTPAFIHTTQTGMVKLDTRVLGDSWSLSSASAINSVGQIIASGSNANVFGVYFLLTPSAGTVAISIADASVSEGNSSTKQLTFTISLSAASAAPVSFDIATSNGTAIAGSDYVASSLVGQAIAAGATSKTFSVTINGDTSVEADETFTVNLGNVAGATVADGQAIGTISNDDATTPSLSISDAFVIEGDGGSTAAIFYINLSQPALAGGVSFDVATSGVRTIGNSARAGSDFAANSRTGVVIPAGQSNSSFVVKVIGDLRVEPDEAFATLVSNVVGATIGDSSGLGIIFDDDEATISSSEAGNALPALIRPEQACRQLLKRSATLIAWAADGRLREDEAVGQILALESRRARIGCEADVQVRW